MKNSDIKFEKWEPKFSAEGKAHLEKLRSTVGERVKLMRSLRKSLGLTQADVASILNMTQANVSKMENRGDVNLSVLERMVNFRGGKVRIVIEDENGQQRESVVL